MFVEWIDKLMCEYFMNEIYWGWIFLLYFLSWDSFINEDLLVVVVFESGNDGCQYILRIILLEIAISDGVGFSFSSQLKVWVTGVWGILRIWRGH